MKKDLKDLLLKDLCGRLPYVVKCIVKSDGYVSFISSIESQYGVVTFDDGRQEEICDIKPYLFPLSSMTEEQREELKNLGWYFDNFEIHNVSECLGTYREYVAHSDCFSLIDWLNKNHFDCRCLIEKGLAIDATNLKIYK